MKIERLLRLDPSAGPLRVLEIGTGAGIIANYFGTHEHLDCDVSAVDVVDQRVVTDSYEFALVEGTELPYHDASFDVVISNHVIEHVGNREAQRRHLQEIRRVMGKYSLGYLATPNRWALIEPHFRLPLLSWLPRDRRHGYVRATGRGERYDCEPLTRRELDDLLGVSGIPFAHIEMEALSSAATFGELSPFLAKPAEWMASSGVGRLLFPLVPTFVCRLG